MTPCPARHLSGCDGKTFADQTLTRAMTLAAVLCISRHRVRRTVRRTAAKVAFVIPDQVTTHRSIDTEGRGQRFHPTPNPLAAKRVIDTRSIVLSRQKRHAYTPFARMYDTHTLFTSNRSSHDWPPLFPCIVVEESPLSIDWWVAPFAGTLPESVPARFRRDDSGSRQAPYGRIG